MLAIYNSLNFFKKNCSYALYACDLSKLIDYNNIPKMVISYTIESMNMQRMLKRNLIVFFQLIIYDGDIFLHGLVWAWCVTKFLLRCTSEVRNENRWRMWEKWRQLNQQKPVSSRHLNEQVLVYFDFRSNTLICNFSLQNTQGNIFKFCESVRLGEFVRGERGYY